MGPSGRKFNDLRASASSSDIGQHFILSFVPSSLKNCKSNLNNPDVGISLFSSISVHLFHGRLLYVCQPTLSRLEIFQLFLFIFVHLVVNWLILISRILPFPVWSLYLATPFGKKMIKTKELAFCLSVGV